MQRPNIYKKFYLWTFKFELIVCKSSKIEKLKELHNFLGQTEIATWKDWVQKC